MEAEIHNDAAGWNDPSYVAQAGSEPTDVTQIKGNFTHTELGAKDDAAGADGDYSTCTGYKVTVGLGHTGDYDGYTVSYREYMARDAYRKALTSYGPHTADYMNTNLVGMAANLLCGTPLIEQPTETILVLISDLYEGGIAEEMVRRASSIVASGATMLALLALSDSGRPSFDSDHASALAAVGVPAFACTPDRFPDLMATAIEKRDITVWAAAHDIVMAHEVQAAT